MMGTNFHSAWVDNVTEFKVPDMNFPLTYLDRALSYAKNIIVHHNGPITYSRITGLLAWAGTVNILFNRSDGVAIRNTLAAGSIVLASNEICYVVLNETNETVLTMQKSAIITNSASGYLAYNRLVLGYRNITSGNFFSYRLFPLPENSVQVLT